jgi:hypothetical protein
MVKECIARSYFVSILYYTEQSNYVKFHVLVAAGMKMIALWDIVLCSLVEVDQCFRGAYCLHHQGVHTDEGGSKHL